MGFLRFISLVKKKLLIFHLRKYDKITHLPVKRRRSIAYGPCTAARYNSRKTQDLITFTTFCPVITLALVIRTVLALGLKTFVRNFATAAVIVRIGFQDAGVRHNVIQSSVLVIWQFVSAILIFAKHAVLITSD